MRKTRTLDQDTEILFLNSSSAITRVYRLGLVALVALSWSLFRSDFWSKLSLIVTKFHSNTRSFYLAVGTSSGTVTKLSQDFKEHRLKQTAS